MITPNLENQRQIKMQKRVKNPKLSRIEHVKKYAIAVSFKDFKAKKTTPLEEIREDGRLLKRMGENEIESRFTFEPI